MKNSYVKDQNLLPFTSMLLTAEYGNENLAVKLKLEPASG